MDQNIKFSNKCFAQCHIMTHGVSSPSQDTHNDTWGATPRVATTPPHTGHILMCGVLPP